MYQQVAYGLLLPFLGTTLGAAMVFLLRNQIASWLQKLLLGFASGVMMAASVWSLLIPSIDMTAESGGVAWMPAVVGFLAGMFSLLLFDSLVPHLHLSSDEPEGMKSGLGRSTMLFLAVTLHNIPEGMAVGISFSLAAQSAPHTLPAAMALALGVGIQNFPEGAAISLPLIQDGFSRRRAFAIGALSGVVEPAAALLTVLIAGQLQPLMPWLLSFAAGSMLYVVVEELIPEANLRHNHQTHSGTLGVMAGFLIMMILDVALG